MELLFRKNTGRFNDWFLIHYPEQNKNFRKKTQKSGIIFLASVISITEKMQLQ